MHLYHQQSHLYTANPSSGAIKLYIDTIIVQYTQLIMLHLHGNNVISIIATLGMLFCPSSATATTCRVYTTPDIKSVMFKIDCAPSTVTL